MIRKFIVRNFALYYKFKILGQPIVVLRITPWILTTFFSYILITEFTDSFDTCNWYDWVLLILFCFQAWMGFSWFGLGYFQRWPIKRSELSEDQKEQFDIFNAV